MSKEHPIYLLKAFECWWEDDQLRRWTRVPGGWMVDTYNRSADEGEIIGTWYIMNSRFHPYSEDLKKDLR